MEEPIYPVGTPEYEAYAADLRTELAKFAKGEEPYPYCREETTMATVPNWIVKGYVYSPGFTPAGDTVHRIKHWRATRTQVVVQVHGRNGEFRFSLETLREIGRCGECWLAAPDSPEVGRVLPKTLKREIVADLNKAMSERMDASEMTVAELADAIDRIHSACSVAIIELGKLAD
jgi:hypothetical protein